LYAKKPFIAIAKRFWQCQLSILSIIAEHTL
jgi:hypothetical protein